MRELTWRVVLDDGTYIHWEDEITLPDGRVKPASIDDIDRDAVGQLLTVNFKGDVLHALTFSQEERRTRKAIWRLVRKIVSDVGIPVTAGALTGYNELLPDGSTTLHLSFIDAEAGEVGSAEGYECELHPREVFSDEVATQIKEKQELQNRASEEDNAILNPLTADNGNLL